MNSFNISYLLNPSFLGLIFTILSIIIAFIIYCISNKKMSPHYFITESSLLAKSFNKNSKFKIMWDNIEISNIYKIQFAFYNSGKTPIRRSDISEDIPITIKCPSSIILLDSFISKTNRSIQIETKNNIEQKKVEIKIINDDAFEQKDGFVIDILYTTDDDIKNHKWCMEGRIISVPKGIKKLNTKIIKNLDRVFFPVWSILTILFFVFILNIPYDQGIYAIIDNITLIAIFGLTGGFLFAIWQLFFNKIPLWLKKQYWDLIRN